jgi:hypothetical protein
MNSSTDLGEPLNAIISGNSDDEVLVDAEVNGGLWNYFLCVSLPRALPFPETVIDPLFSVLTRSLGFSGECLGQIGPGQQGANLGDGAGWSMSPISAVQMFLKCLFPLSSHDSKPDRNCPMELWGFEFGYM